MTLEGNVQADLIGGRIGFELLAASACRGGVGARGGIGGSCVVDEGDCDGVCRCAFLTKAEEWEGQEGQDGSVGDTWAVHRAGVLVLLGLSNAGCW